MKKYDRAKFACKQEWISRQLSEQSELGFLLRRCFLSWRRRVSQSQLEVMTSLKTLSVRKNKGMNGKGMACLVMIILHQPHMHGPVPPTLCQADNLLAPPTLSWVNYLLVPLTLRLADSLSAPPSLSLADHL